MTFPNLFFPLPPVRGRRKKTGTQKSFHQSTILVNYSTFPRDV
jgi:hypothetical protein